MKEDRNGPGDQRWLDPAPEVLTAYAWHGDRAIAQRSLSAAPVYFVAVLLLFFTTSYYQDHPRLLLLAGGLTSGFALVRILAALAILRKKERGPGRRSIALRIALYGTFATWGVFSGVTVRLYMPNWPMMLVLLATASGAGGVAVSLASDKKLAYRCLCLMVAPTAFAGFAAGRPDSVGVGIGSAMYLVVLLSQAIQNWRTHWAGILALEAEKARLHAEDVARAKSALLAQLSHEIRTPMNGVMGMLELLLETQLTTEQREYAEASSASAQTLLAIVNSVLDYSKAEAGGVQLEEIRFDLQRTLSSSLAPFAAQAKRKGLRFHWSTNPSLDRNYVGDSVRFAQIVMNLAANAIRFTPAGEVSVSMNLVKEDGGCHWIRLSVSDTGVGIAKEARARIFEAFQQGHSSTYGGTGLGLAISKHLVELMRGSIELESEVGVGSTFWFTAPFRRVDAAEAARADSQLSTGAALPSPVGRILVAEDNAVNQLVTRRMLERLGCAVDVVGNGAEALNALSRGRYDLVLMDCNMPGMDGPTAARTIRSSETGTSRRIPIVAITAGSVRMDRAKCMAAGMDDYLNKPVTLSDLSAVVSTFVRKQPLLNSISP